MVAAHVVKTFADTVSLISVVSMLSDLTAGTSTPASSQLLKDDEYLSKPVRLRYSRYTSVLDMLVSVKANTAKHAMPRAYRSCLKTGV